MKERPILFSAPMVRAILAGQKTQTRRILKSQPSQHQDGDEHEWWRPLSGKRSTWTSNRRIIKTFDQQELVHEEHRYMSLTEWLLPECPYGQPGDRLWVRETFNVGWLDQGQTLYRADGGSAKKCGYPSEPKWKPGIHMPRWASRITLEITDVRVQRLRDISAEDAIAEGIRRELSCDGENYGWLPAHDGPFELSNYPRNAFMHSWNHINGDTAWQQNPWVWALTFKRVEGQAA